VKRPKFYNSVNYRLNIRMLSPSKKFSKSPTNRSCCPFNIRCKRPKDKKSCRHTFGPLGQKYLRVVLSGKKVVNINNIYRVYFSSNGTMLTDKRIDLDKNDDIIVDGKRYLGTPGLYELIFKKFPDETICTNAEKQKYKSILLATNAHRRGHSTHNSIMGNKGHKYKSIIATLLSGKKIRKDMPHTVTLNDNEIDYVHWNNSNKLVNRLRLLEVSRQAGHNAHNNEILSTIKELCKADLIIKLNRAIRGIQ